jgi:hypothetical protein
MIKKTLFLWMALFMLPVHAGAESTDLAGIFPAVASPGSTVTIIGGPYGRDIQVVFGDRTLTPASIGEKRLTFTVPPLPEGDYLLYLKDEKTQSDRSLFFRVVLPSPGIESLTPPKIDVCVSGEQREVTLRGKDMQPGVQVLLDGVAMVASHGDETLLFTLPELAPGLHQVQLINPDGKRSLPVSLLIDALPEIEEVSRGDENGKNFSYNSMLVVNGQPIAPFYPGSLQVDSISYLDCNHLIYKRYPPSSQIGQINLQIVNPDGRESPVFTFSGP